MFASKISLTSNKTANLGAILRSISSSPVCFEDHKCRVLVVGGGSGGCTLAAKLCSHLKCKDDVIVLEPSEFHYYQPMFTMVGGGMKTLEQSRRSTSSVLPKRARWLKDFATKIQPDQNQVLTSSGDKITYEYLLLAVGLKLDYDKISGLTKALSMPDGNVCSNYSPMYVDRTFAALRKFKEGNAIFTFPESPIKCPGAPQKIVYIAEHYFRKTGKRSKANLQYHTSLGVLFGVPRYADALWEVVRKREIDIKLRSNLVEVRPDKNEAVFRNLDSGEESIIEYSLLHVTPPMSPPVVLSSCSQLVNAAGYLDVDKDTLRHVKYNNVFGIGDCISSPNSKTAAAIAGQSAVVHANLKSVMNGKDEKSKMKIYDGYASCPLVTGYDKCILAEFDYSMKPLETFPLRQDRERRTMFHLKKDIMPALYWHGLLRGYWNGPGMMRKIMNVMKFD